MSTLRVSNIEAKADVSSPTVDEKIKFTNSSGDVLFHLDGKTSGITTVGINTTGNTFTVNNTTGDISFSGSVTSSGVSTFTSDVSIADKIVHIGDTDTAIRFPAADTITAETGGTERLRIDSSGNVAIGHNSPRSKLDVFETVTGNQTAIRIGNTNTPTSANDKRLEFVDGTGTSEGTNKYTYGYIQGYREGGSNSGALIFGTKPDNGSAPSERLRITSSGNVGIGTDNPGAILEVVAASSQRHLRVITHSSGDSCLQSVYPSNGTLRTITLEGSTVDFYTGSGSDTTGTFRGRFNSSGNLGIGTNNAERKIHVFNGSSGASSSNSNTGLILENSAASYLTFFTPNTVSPGLLFQDPEGASGQLTYSHSENAMLFSTAGSEKVRITSDGDVGIGDNAPNNNYGTNLSIHSTGTDGVRLKLSDGSTGKGNLDGLDIISTGSQAYFIQRENGSMLFYTNNTEAARFTAAGNLAFPSGQGIDFSATGNGLQTMSSELLDDYEEGTCSMYLATSSKTSQISSSGGTGITYTKIGRKIHIYGYIVFSNVQSTLGGNHVHLWGFPYNFSSFGNSVDNGIWIWTNGTAPTNYWDGKFPGISCQPNLDGGGMYSHGYNGYIALNGNNIGNNGLHFNFDYTYQI